MTKQTPRTLTGLALTIITLACSTTAPTDDQTAPIGNAPDSQTLPPPGYGTLRQDDFTVALQTGDVQLKVTPLHEGIIRLAAPDTYQRLHGMVASRHARIQEMARQAGLSTDPGVYLVSFFTRARQAQFEPTGLQLLSKGILYRPLGILPLTPGWGRQQVGQEETQSALYLFDPAVDLDVSLEVDYDGARSFAWSRIIRTLQAERARVQGRVEQ